MRWPRTFCLLIAAAALAAGCKSRTDLVEAELRVKDRQIREMRDDLERSSNLNEAYENSLRCERGSCPPRAVGCSHPMVKQLQIGRGTGGIDEDRCPGDEGILVVLAPMDADNSAVKVGGNVRITAMQITPEGLKIPLSTWDVSAGYLQRHWKTGLISTGYYVSLPWQAVPSFEKLRLIATFTTIDGAVFEAEKDITIYLGQGIRRDPVMSSPVPNGAIVQPVPEPQMPPAHSIPAPVPVSNPRESSFPLTSPNPHGSALPPPVPASYSGPSLSWKPSFGVASAAQLQRPVPVK